MLDTMEQLPHQNERGLYALPQSFLTYLLVVTISSYSFDVKLIKPLMVWPVGLFQM